MKGISKEKSFSRKREKSSGGTGERRLNKVRRGNYKGGKCRVVGERNEVTTISAAWRRAGLGGRSLAIDQRWEEEDGPWKGRERGKENIGNSIRSGATIRAPEYVSSSSIGSSKRRGGGGKKPTGYRGYYAIHLKPFISPPPVHSSPSTFPLLLRIRRVLNRFPFSPPPHSSPFPSLNFQLYRSLDLEFLESNCIKINVKIRSV